METKLGSNSRYKTYSEFFPFYLSEHSNRTCRLLHYAATTTELVFVTLFIVTLNPLLLLAALVGAYSFAWVGHFVFEKNTPATFTYPVWSYLADHHMLWLAVTGKLHRQLKDAQAKHAAT